MKPLYRNLFLLFGVAAIIVMLCTFDVDYTQLYSHLLRAGLYLPAVIGVWIFVYAFNAWAFQIIVNSGTPSVTLISLLFRDLPLVTPRPLALVEGPIVLWNSVPTSECHEPCRQ